MTIQNHAFISILGVKISCLSEKDALFTVSNWLIANSKKQYFIATPNPEMLVLAQTDAQFKQILNSADLALPDGAGLVWGSKMLRIKNQESGIKNRISGVDFMMDLCGLATTYGYTVGLLGAQTGVAEKTAESLKGKYPGLKIKFAVSEISQLSLRVPPSAGRSNLIKIDSHSPLRGLRNDFKVDLLFVAYGAPKQEYLIKMLIAKCKWPLAKVYMSVGGAFDLISGRVKRAPTFIQNIGLEWLFRLCMEPWRLKRIWMAVIVFPWLVINSILTNKD